MASEINYYSTINAAVRMLFVAALFINPFLLTTITLMAESTGEQTLNTTTTTITTTTTTTPIPTTTTTTISSTTAEISSQTTTTTTPKSLTTTTTIESMTKSQEEIDEIKRKILKHVDKNDIEKNRLGVNKPTLPPQIVDFNQDSMEAKVSDATSQFGLKFLNNIFNKDNSKENIIISPLSLQNLLNMILLGSSENSSTYNELYKILGYETAGLLSNSTAATTTTTSFRLRPHEAMNNVFQSILSATHLTINQDYSSSSGSGTTPTINNLLNTNSDALNKNQQDINEKSTTAGVGNLAGHLQTSKRDGEQPLDGQLNFTLANLVLTNKDLVELNDDYEKELKKYYDVEVEQFSRDSKTNNNNNNDDDKLKLPLHDRVNNWVKNITQGQIEKLVSENDLNDQDLVMVLLNGAHFKGRWLHTFATQATHENLFYNNGLDDNGNNVKFMRQKGVFGYADFGIASLQMDASSSPFSNGGNNWSQSESKVSKSTDDSETLLTEDGTTTTTTAPKNDDQNNKSSSSSSTMPTIELSKEEAKKIELTNKLNCSVLMLPFSLNDGQELSMVIILPAKRDGLQDLQNVLDFEILNEIYKSLSEQTVQVELPKFSFDGSYDAKSILLKMGLKSIFNDNANLDLMFKKNGFSSGGSEDKKVSSANKNAKVDKIIHKAKILIDESGAEAAAASMGSVVLRNFIRPPAPRFIADHPFLFIIRHNRSNMPLFMGTVNNL